MKKFIWCLKTVEESQFCRKAHTVPEKLGGNNICINVCDPCNSYFGNHYQGLPPVETAIKEAFNITRARLLATSNDIGKNKTLPRFTSLYFIFDLKKYRFSVKPKYNLQRSFQENICRQFKKGLYKMFLEETERQLKIGHNNQFDFIREFARYNIGDYPVFYFERKHGIFYMSKEWVKNPEIFLDKDFKFKYLVEEAGFYELEILGHVFGFPITRNWELVYDNYIKKSINAKKDIFKSYKVIKSFNDIDLALKIMDR